MSKEVGPQKVLGELGEVDSKANMTGKPLYMCAVDFLQLLLLFAMD